MLKNQVKLLELGHLPVSLACTILQNLKGLNTDFWRTRPYGQPVASINKLKHTHNVYTYWLNHRKVGVAALALNEIIETM
jgi:hypothetical protein